MADALTEKQAAYRVLARKYRPNNFDTLIGQDAMVRTLSNAIETDRLAHAFILTGVRGVGKTTTARILAKALNCSAHDGPSVNPCGECEQCVAIAESRHVDVMEMDAASHTGVDDIREIIDSVRYGPTSSRLKIYIIDEVHMLSKNAFNALLKTLEEPPEHVKFIFATTEIRKLPVTVLSRCQRFDLKRVESDVLVDHLAKIVAKEGCNADDAALQMIVRASEGSVRDSLSLLDQAIAHGAGTVSEAQVRDMLGLADRAQILDLFKHMMAGEAAEAITLLRDQYNCGADPAVVINDLLDVTHWLTRLKVTPETGNDTLVSEAEKTQGGAMAESLAMPHLTRAWQMLLKGVQEVRLASSPIAAAEMLLIRLAYAANLPSPVDLVKQIKAGNGAAKPVGGGNIAPTNGNAGGTSRQSVGQAVGQGSEAKQQPSTSAATAQVLALKAGGDSDHAPHPLPVSFEKMVDLFRQEKEGQLAFALSDLVRLVNYRPGAFSLNLDEKAPAGLVMRVKDCLKRWTGTDWQVTIVRDGGESSLREKAVAHQKQLLGDAAEDNLVMAVMATFPGAKIYAVREDKPEELLAESDEMAEHIYDDEPVNDFDF